METPTNMVFIPPGTFRMGSPPDEVDRWDWEGPQTAVTISRGFWLGKYEITQGEYLAVMGNNPSWFSGVRQVWDPESELEIDVDYTDLTRPVETVSWNDAVAYCAALAEQERTAGRIAPNSVYRLPTEAEWEWCLDWYGDYAGGIAVDLQGPGTGSIRVFRGGRWGYARNCRSANRYDSGPGLRYSFIGFRAVLAPGQP